MHNNRLRNALPRCLLSALLIGGITTTASVNAVDGIGTHDLKLFELEGNTADNPAGPPTDWDALHSGATPANMITFTGVLPDPAPQTIFWKGGSKDVSDVSEWWYKQGSVSDKSNITNAYAAAYTAPADVCVTSASNNTVVDCATAGSVVLHEQGDLIVYFGMDRFANSGDTFGGFWFFQDPAVGIGDVNGQGQFSGNHVAATATEPGDVLVLVEYPQASGATPEIKVYEWDPNQVRGPNIAPNLSLRFTASQAECNNADGLGKLACAKVNLVTLPNPPWDYTPKGGNANSVMPTQTFFEGGINLTGILGSTPCISSFLAETRSSRSETASLEDFAFGGFDACGANVSKSCEAEISETGDSVTVTFWGEVNNTGGLPLDIELEDDQANSTFTKVCVDGSDSSTPDGRCVGEANIAGLTLGAIASFNLGGGQSVVYEGQYSLSEFDETTEFVDTVTLRFYDPGTGALIDTETATSAECPPTGDPSILVTKLCFANLTNNGSQIDRSFSGTVSNDGNVKLDGVNLSDSDYAGAFSAWLDDGDGVFDDSLDSPFALPGALEPGDLLFYSFEMLDGEFAHSNTITASGTNVFDQSTVSANAVVTECSPDVNPGLSLTKDCDPENAGVRLVADGGVVLVEVDNVIVVENTGDVALAVTVSDDQVQALVEEGSALFTCPPATPNSCTGTLNPGVSATFRQTYRPDGLSLGAGGSLELPSSVSFVNTATATATAAVGGDQVAADPVSADCPLCPAP
ncbi:hypothetical protein EA796_17610 [Pseudomonas sp. AOB-7]|uniref:hypothetical protein n=1 Tax=Pseudomonas sp. AOB-7 TaxID=2482750 RepID=UPI000EFBDBB8|nr:hypothetical protein [Pseudomonas sp. AOB-7]RMH82994.1 hypothetical protein EA796_17610 [Pseudomonas sp. AOB-7]